MGLLRALRDASHPIEFIRPIITYVMFGAFIAFKFMTYHDAVSRNADPLQILPVVWNPETMTILSTIVSFWFGNRAMERYYGPCSPTTKE